MKKLKRMIAIGSVALIVVTTTACSSTNDNAEAGNTSTTASESTQSDTETNSTEVASNTKVIANSETGTDKAGDSIVYGKVTAIDGSTLTLALGDMPQGNTMDGGQAPDGQTPNKDDATNNQQPGTDQSKDAPDGNKEASKSDTNQGNSKPPSGEKQSQQPPTSGDGETPDMSSLFVESGEAITITIDDSLIKIMSGGETTTGSLSDIAVDSILSIQYDDSKSVTSITVILQPSALK